MRSRWRRRRQHEAPALVIGDFGKDPHFGGAHFAVVILPAADGIVLFLVEDILEQGGARKTKGAQGFVVRVGANAQCAFIA